MSLRIAAEFAFLTGQRPALLSRQLPNMHHSGGRGRVSHVPAI